MYHMMTVLYIQILLEQQILKVLITYKKKIVAMCGDACLLDLL